MRTLLNRLLYFLRRSRHDADLREEMETHRSLRQEKLEREGAAPSDAEHASLRALGNVTLAREDARQVWIGPALESVWQDIRFVLRGLRKSPGFALVAIATLALGIGSVVATFSVVHSVLWRALPYPDADRLVAIDVDARGQSGLGPAPDELRDLRERGRLLTRVSTINGVYAFLDVDGSLDHVSAASVSDEMLPMLGATPLALGRHLSARDDVVSERVAGVVVSDRVWRTHLAADPAVVGRRIVVNGIDVAVVGVTRPGIRLYLPASLNTTEEIDVWFPVGEDSSRRHSLHPALALLAPGATIATAQAELDKLAGDFLREHPNAYVGGTLRMRLSPLQDALTSDARPTLIALGGAVVFVLIIAWVNVANLLIARSKVREREMAVRRALGATPARIARQLLTESVVVAAISGGVGLALAVGSVRLFIALFPAHLPRQTAIAIDFTTVLFAVGVTALTVIVLGLLPALKSGADDATSLRAGRSGAAAPRRKLQRALLVAEVALTVMPLIAAGLMLRTFVNLAHAPVGFDASEILTARMSLSPRAYPDVDRRLAIYRDAVDRLRHLPGVEAVSAVHPLPLAPLQIMRTYAPAGEQTSESRIAAQQVVLPGYLDVVGTRLVAGRDFSDADIAERRTVAIVDERIAAQLWAGDAIGQRMAFGPAGTVVEIVGVTNAVRSTSVRDDVPTVFVPYHLFSVDMSLVIKSARAGDLAPDVRQVIASLGTGRPAYDVRPLNDYMADSIAATKLTTAVLVVFGAATLLLAAIGLYGTLTYLTSTRIQEFGVRLALGDTPLGLVRLVSREALVLAAIGIALGFAATTSIVRAIDGLLYGVTSTDMVTWLSVAGLVIAVALVATIQPAWRASRVGPASALRGE